MKIRAYTHPLRRAAASMWQALSDYPAVPAAIAVAILILVNQTFLD